MEEEKNGRGEKREEEMEEEKKGDKKLGCFTIVTIVSIVLIIGLDIFACFIANQAEVSQQNVEHKRVGLLECKAPSQTAFVLGIIALSCLVASHIIANLIGFSYELFKSTITGYVNLACCCVTWILGIIGAGALLMGIWSNRASRSKCGITNKHVLSFGGKVCFLHALVSIIFYVSTIFAKKTRSFR